MSPHERDDRDAERGAGKLPFAPLLWTIGYSGLHVTVLVRAVMAFQKPALLASLSFWAVSMALVVACVALMTAGWGDWRR